MDVLAVKDHVLTAKKDKSKRILVFIQNPFIMQKSCWLKKIMPYNLAHGDVYGFTMVSEVL